MIRQGAVQETVTPRVPLWPVKDALPITHQLTEGAARQLQGMPIIDGPISIDPAGITPWMLSTVPPDAQPERYSPIKEDCCAP
jgi:hypothetical protein